MTFPLFVGDVWTREGAESLVGQETKLRDLRGTAHDARVISVDFDPDHPGAIRVFLEIDEELSELSGSTLGLSWLPAS